MAVGTWSKSSVDSPNASKLLAAIDQNLKLNVGSNGLFQFIDYDSYSQTDWYGNTTAYKIYQLNISGSAQYGAIYCRLWISSDLRIYTNWTTTWNKVNHVGQNSSNDISGNNFSDLQSINFFTVFSTEYTFVIAQQQNNSYPVGWIIPEGKRPWVKDSMYFIFFPTNNQFDPWQSLGIHAFGTQPGRYYTNLNNNYLALPNPNNDNQSDSESGIIFRSDTRQGDAGKSSDDLISVAASGMSLFQPITDPTTGYSYRLLFNGPGGLAVRVSN